MHHALWQSVLGEIELSVTRDVFETWFKHTEILESTDEQLVISVANIFVKSQFEGKYHTLITDTLAKNGVAGKAISYQINMGNKRRGMSRETTPADVRAMQQGKSPVAAPASLPRTNLKDGSLNPRYTFENFIVGGSNDLAYAACQAVAAEPGVKYNPLFLYGGVGLGKTHLMQAVGNEIVRREPDTRILYISTETFVTEFLEHIRFKKKGFSEKYRNVDVLIVDDMQFIAGKEKTQEEFFHTFNALHHANKQLIISSDKPPKSIPTLTERLRSRFEWGMAIDIQLPDFETRCAIVQTKASLSNIELSRETIEYLATNIKTNVRELEGALNQLLAYAEMRGVNPDISIAEGIVGNVRQSRPHHITPRQIVDKTARHFQVDIKEICGQKREKHIVVPRQIAMYLLRSELHMSFPQIAGELGKKDHTTAIHSVEKIERAMKLDLVVREQVAEIREKLYA